MDQNTIGEESKEIKFNRGLDLFIESLLKPDPKLRACASFYLRSAIVRNAIDPKI